MGAQLMRHVASAGLLVNPILSLGLEALLVGHVQKIAFEASAEDIGKGKSLRVETLSVNPPIFMADDFLDATECDSLISEASVVGLSPMPRHFDLRDDQSFFLPKPVPGSLWDVWNTVDANSDGSLDAAELLQFVQRRLHLHAFSLKDAHQLLARSHEHGFPYMSRQTFSSYDWDGFLTSRHSLDPSHFVRYGHEAVLRPTLGQTLESRVGGRVLGAEPKVLARLRSKVARLLGWPEDGILPGQGNPLRVINYGLEGHHFCHFDSDETSIASSGRKSVRAVTVHVFLNDVLEHHGGDLLFPAAGPKDGEVFEQHELERRCYEWCNGTRGVQLSKGHFGLRIPPKRGRVVLWHNHAINHSESVLAGDRISASLNADCPVQGGDKWVASFHILLRAHHQTPPSVADASTSIGRRPRDEF